LISEGAVIPSGSMLSLGTGIVPDEREVEGDVGLFFIVLFHQFQVVTHHCDGKKCQSSSDEIVFHVCCMSR